MVKHFYDVVDLFVGVFKLQKRKINSESSFTKKNNHNGRNCRKALSLN